MTTAAVTAPVTLTRFQADLLGWYGRHRRSLPWRDTDDAYAVLVSEIMLQQTQVARVLPLFSAFMSRFPDVRSLAAAPSGDVLKAWKGLGYNRRAIALQRAAQAIVADHDGVVPEDLDALEALPGIGPYTARAVRAFAFGLDDAPVDTNIARVLARVVAGVPQRGVALRRLAESAVPAGRGRDWNAALMDLGATVCTSRSPACDDCPVRAVCAWRAGGGDDPAASPARPPQAFVGSARFHRGRLLDALRGGPVEREDLPTAAATHDGPRAAAIARALVDDGLAAWDGDVLRLPG